MTRGNAEYPCADMAIEKALLMLCRLECMIRGHEWWNRPDGQTICVACEKRHR